MRLAIRARALMHISRTREYAKFRPFPDELLRSASKRTLQLWEPAHSQSITKFFNSINYIYIYIYIYFVYF